MNDSYKQLRFLHTDEIARKMVKKFKRKISKEMRNKKEYEKGKKISKTYIDTGKLVKKSIKEEKAEEIHEARKIDMEIKKNIFPY